MTTQFNNNQGTITIPSDMWDEIKKVCTGATLFLTDGNQSLSKEQVAQMAAALGRTDFYARPSHHRDWPMADFRKMVVNHPHQSLTITRTAADAQNP